MQFISQALEDPSVTLQQMTSEKGSQTDVIAIKLDHHWMRLSDGINMIVCLHSTMFARP